MLGSLARVASRSDDYGIFDFFRDFLKNCVCCVVDSEHRNERCCALTTVDPNGYDYFDCGHVNEADMESPHVHQRRQIERWIRRLLFFGLLVWGLVGVFAVINPTMVMFNVVVDEDYRNHLDEGKALKESALEHRLQMEEKKKEEELGANVITNFLNELLRSDKANEKDKTAVMHVLELASEKMASAHCEAVVITAPIKVYGASCLFYALLCMILLAEDIQLRTGTTSAHLAWYVCGIIGYALATAGHGRTMESSTFTFCMLALNSIMAVAWFVARERIMRHTALMAADVPQTKPL